MKAQNEDLEQQLLETQKTRRGVSYARTQQQP